MKRDKFPQRLLKEPAQVRLQHFLDHTVAHPRLLEAHESLHRAIRCPIPGTLVFVSGPAGVGKTTLWRKVIKELIEASLPQLEEDRGRIPVVGIEAPSSDSGVFNWKDFYRRFLQAMNEPLIDHKVILGESAPDVRAARPQTVSPRAVATELRLAVEQSLRHRRTAAVLIDEAQHFSRIASGRRLQDQLDTLKSLSNMTGTLIVLFGSYELHPFRNLSGQLSRRGTDVHFPRYDAKVDGDKDAFRNVLYTLQRQIPLDEEPDFDARWDYFYERSIGCVGVLKDWLTRAYEDALKEGGKRLTDRQIERCALSTSQCEKMLAEALEGEKNLRETEEKRRSLRARLGLVKGGPDSPSEEGKETVEVHGDGGVSVTKSARAHKKQVGKRKPFRDKVGRGVSRR